VYSAFLSNVEEFRKLDCLPVEVNFSNQDIIEQFVHNKAAWHKQSHQKFNTSMLKHMQLKTIKVRILVSVDQSVSLYL